MMLVASGQADPTDPVEKDFKQDFLVSVVMCNDISVVPTCFHSDLHVDALREMREYAQAVVTPKDAAVTGILP